MNRFKLALTAAFLTLMSAGGAAQAQPLPKIINTPASFGAVNVIVAKVSGTSNVRAYIQRKSDGFCTFVTLDTGSGLMWDHVIINGGVNNDTMVIWNASVDAAGSAFHEINDWTSITCSNLGRVTTAYTPDYASKKIVMNGGDGFDVIAISGHHNEGTGGPSDDRMISFNTSGGVLKGESGYDGLVDWTGHLTSMDSGTENDCVVHAPAYSTNTSISCGNDPGNRDTYFINNSNDPVGCDTRMYGVPPYYTSANLAASQCFAHGSL